jgi:hypothetical protein
MFTHGGTHARFQCWICDTSIDTPLYWVDPKSYDVDSIKTLCGPKCALEAYNKVKHTFKPQHNLED